MRLRLMWPWQDRSGKLSWLKATTFALMFAPPIWLAHQVGAEELGPFPLDGMIYWSGVWATAMLLLALAITPLVTILHWDELIGVRRIIGVTTLAYTIAHLVIFFALRFWNFASIVDEMVTRASLISATVATMGLITMGATSVDAAIRHMGPHAWTRLHNAIYAIAALALTHFLFSPDAYPEQYLMTGIFFWLMLWRVLNGHSYGTDIRALLGLALASGLFTAILEAGWLWAFHEYAASETLRNNLTLVLGVSPAWKVLALGVLIAVAGASRKSFGFKTSGLAARKFG